MALTTYAGLKTALGEWLLARGTTDIPDRVDEFFALARAKIFYGCSEKGYESQPLRIRFMETAVDLTIDDNEVALPTGYLQTRRFFIPTTPIVRPRQIGPGELREKYAYTTQVGVPMEYAIEGENLIFGPVPDQTYTGKFLYYKIPDALTSDAQTDWLMVNSPGVYLFGALAEFALFVQDYDNAKLYSSRMAGAVNSLMFADEKDRWSGEKLATSPATLIV